MIRNLGYVNPGRIAKGEWLTNPHRVGSRRRRNPAALAMIGNRPTRFSVSERRYLRHMKPAEKMGMVTKGASSRLARVMLLSKRLRSSGLSASEAMREAWRKIKSGGSTMANPRRRSKSRRRTRRFTRVRRSSPVVRRRRSSRRKSNPFHRRRRSSRRNPLMGGALGMLRLPKGAEWIAFAGSIAVLPYVARMVVSFIPLDKIENPKAKAAVMIAVETGVGLLAAWGVSKASKPVGDLLALLVWYRLAQRVAGEISAGRVGTLAAIDFLEPSRLGFLEPRGNTVGEGEVGEGIGDVNDVPMS